VRRSKERKPIVRLTVDVPEETWVRLKVATAEERTTIKDLMNELIATYLKGRGRKGGKR